MKKLYVLTALAFLAWMLFFDSRDLVTQWQRGQELKKLEASKKYYSEQIAIENAELQQLKTSPDILEKYARERYMMKRVDEDLFIIQPAKE